MDTDWLTGVMVVEGFITTTSFQWAWPRLITPRLTAYQVDWLRLWRKTLLWWQRKTLLTLQHSQVSTHFESNIEIQTLSSCTIYDRLLHKVGSMMKKPSDWSSQRRYTKSLKTAPICCFFTWTSAVHIMQLTSMSFQVQSDSLVGCLQNVSKNINMFAILYYIILGSSLYNIADMITIKYSEIWCS
jgi:hypothetical protein